MTAESDRRAAIPVDASQPVDAYQPVVLLREAIMTGLLGAATIMVWFLVLDTIDGRPLYTPTVLGTVLVGPETTSLDDLPISVPMVLFYTVIHGLAFCLVGCVAAWLFAIAERNPTVIFGLLLLFIFFFCGFLAVTMLTEPAVLKVVTIPAILAGNVLAAFVMGRYLWRRHPLDLRRLL